ncbi:kinase-like domain-containing protein [Phyllosticta citrichinensis]
MDWDERAETTHALRTIKWIEQYRARKEDLPTWMASFRQGHSCIRLTQMPLAGSFNFCFPFEFDDGIKWLVRFPIPGRTMDPDGKLLREVAVMKHLQANTSLPIPTIHAWGRSTDDSLGLGPFVIMDFVEGVNLGDLWKDPTASRLSRSLRSDISDQDMRIVFRQMSRFLLQLYELRFEKIGSLVVGEDGQVGIHGPPLTWKMQEIEAHSGIKVGGDRVDPFDSSAEYFRWIADMDWKHLNEQPNSVDNAEDARSKFVFARLFPKTVPRFVAQEHENAPFGLVCDDLRYGNMLVNNAEELKIVAIVDWEWSYTAPLQLCYNPPRAIWGKLPHYLWPSEPHCELARYMEVYGKFIDELVREEGEQFGDGDGREKLSALMQKSMDDGKFWFNEIIFSCYMEGDNLAWKNLCRQFPDISGEEDIEESELLRFVEEKVQLREMYDEGERKLAESLAARETTDGQEAETQGEGEKRVEGGESHEGESQEGPHGSSALGREDENKASWKESQAVQNFQPQRPESPAVQ